VIHKIERFKIIRLERFKIKEQFWINIYEVLSQRQKNEITRPDLKPSAVLFPIFKKGEDIHILFTQRTMWVDNHKGQISFPGGRFQENDANLMETAFREGEEEIGLKKEDTVLVGELDDAETIVSNFKISPYVVALPYPYKFKINKNEVENIFRVPLKDFLDCRNFYSDNQNGIVPPYFKVQDKVIWGATARIVINFLSIIYPQDWNCLNKPSPPRSMKK